MGHQQKLGSYGKNRIFGPKTEILGPKKGGHFLGFTMFWPRPGKVVQRKNTLFQNRYQSHKEFRVFFLGKMHFWPKKHFSAERKNSRFSVILAWIRSVVSLGHFLMAQMVPSSFFGFWPKNGQIWPKWHFWPV